MKEYKNSLMQSYTRFVSLNVMGMLGLSCYLIADTFFISQATGAGGITALNLCLPIYSLIYAIGAMLGVGSATRFSIDRGRGTREGELRFSSAVFAALAASVPFVLGGLLCPGEILALMGGDEEIISLGLSYTRTFLLCTPCFMLNHIFGAFVRNDGDPSLAMTATLAASAFNIVFDYILMFPLGMGMQGAALATGISPMVGVLIASLHFLRRENTIHFVWAVPKGRRLLDCCKLGISAFIGEFSSGVTTTVFNFLILSLAGNIGVAAYGVVANFALVALAVFNGIAQGSQPLISSCYGRGDRQGTRRLLGYGLMTALVLAAVLYAAVFAATDELVALFNPEGSALMAQYAREGIRIYFTGFLFAGVNIVCSGYLSAANCPRGAAICSISRGIVSIVISALLLGALFGMRGVWLAFPAAEGMTLLLLLLLTRRGLL